VESSFVLKHQHGFVRWQSKSKLRVDAVSMLGQRENGQFVSVEENWTTAQLRLELRQRLDQRLTL
jgi:uncharacterized protein YbgA (DUF1722 family)